MAETSRSLLRSKNRWEEMAHLDPCWAILSEPGKRYGKWKLEEFFLRGDEEISWLLEFSASMGYPSTRNVALDFGCGIGRLSRALSKHFESCVGVDISEEMIRKARTLNGDVRNCEFLLNKSNALEMFSDNYFDLIYTSIVLQHVVNKAVILGYVREFVRTLKPAGLLVMQIPSFIPRRKMVQPRRRLYELLRYVGAPESLLYGRLGLTPIRMNFVPEQEVLVQLASAKAVALKVQPDTKAGKGIESRTYFVTKSATSAGS